MAPLSARLVSAAALAALVGFTATSCTLTDAASDRSATPTATADPNPGADAMATVTPAQVEAAVADLGDSIEDAMAATGTPGIAVGVVYRGELVYAEGFGVRDVDTGEPVDADTVFPLASLSKSLSATVVARAIDEGIVAWDTPVADNLEGFTLSDPYVGAHVTIADMFAHRSGLYEHAGDELEEIGYDRADVLERLRYIPLEQFRAIYHYGNFDITAAGESVARAAGEEWADLAERLVYEPLGMDSTSFRFADLEARDNRALGHVERDGEWMVTPEQRRPDEQAPAGGASSSIADMSTWLRVVLASGVHDGEEFVSPEALLPAVSPEMPMGVPGAFGSRSGFYGYGFNVGTTAGGLVDVNHSGAFALGAGTVFKMLPAAGLGLVVLSNGAANGVPEGIAGRFVDIAQFGHERRDWLALYGSVVEDQMAPLGELVGEDPPADPAPADELASYAGEYANEYFGPARVTVEGETLALSLGPTGSWPLEHWSGDEFVFRPEGENGTPGTVSRATFDSDTLVLEYFDQHGLGTFTR
ncbi:serine hydrolase [Microbacterium sp. CPCC 204701]|uniref:serine hydrolase n=1 Tax=Microbacterium sp. CPCC 204701 TaxID=2493084 RepID=UPI000FD79D27|nr:serine hydrolase [Microbacterium sp. CPCC 204701]